MKGFTLVETVVSLGILVVLLALVAGAYGRFADVQREGVGQQEMQEDVRLFLQLFNREARTAFGNTYQETKNPPGIVFRNQEGRCVQYAHDQGWHAITRAEATPSLTHDCADTAIYSVTRTLTDTTNTVVDRLLFKVVPAEPIFVAETNEPYNPVLTTQGLVTVYMTVHAAADAAEPTYLESSVTSRQFTAYDYRERP